MKNKFIKRVTSKILKIKFICQMLIQIVIDEKMIRNCKRTERKTLKMRMVYMMNMMNMVINFHKLMKHLSKKKRKSLKYNKMKRKFFFRKNKKNQRKSQLPKKIRTRAYQKPIKYSNRRLSIALSPKDILLIIQFKTLEGMEQLNSVYKILSI